MKRWLILAEGKAAGQFAPLDLIRPCFTIRDGAFTNADRWIALLEPTAVTYEAREMLTPLLKPQVDDDDSGPDSKPDEIWTVEGMVQPLPDEMWDKEDIPDFTWTSGRCRVSKVSSKAKSAAPTPQALPFRALDGLWNLIEHLPDQLTFDFELWKSIHKTGAHKLHAPTQGVFVVGDSRMLWAGENVQVYAQNVLNTEDGPIILDDDVILEPFNRIDGPAYIGKGTTLLGGKFTSGTAIGPGCKIGGEWEASIAQGFVNKAHAGFFGHGILGEWVNLGAMTTNSDLKNNYGSVRVMRDGSEVDTGHIKVGSYIADHSKTGIGTLIPTGATWGVGVNYFGGDMAPKDLPSFVWGTKEKFVEHTLEKMIETANSARARRADILHALGRSEVMTQAAKNLLTELHASTKSARAAVIRETKKS